MVFGGIGVRGCEALIPSKVSSQRGGGSGLHVARRQSEPTRAVDLRKRPAAPGTGGPFSKVLLRMSARSQSPYDGHMNDISARLPRLPEKQETSVRSRSDLFGEFAPRAD